MLDLCNVDGLTGEAFKEMVSAEFELIDSGNNEHLNSFETKLNAIMSYFDIVAVNK